MNSRIWTYFINWELILQKAAIPTSGCMGGMLAGPSEKHHLQLQLISKLWKQQTGLKFPELSPSCHWEGKGPLLRPVKVPARETTSTGSKVWQDWRVLGTSSSSSCTDFVGKKGGDNSAEAKTPHRLQNMLKPRLLTKALKPPALLATLKRRKMLQSMDTATSVTIRDRTSLKGQRQAQTAAFSHTLVSISHHGHFQRTFRLQGKRADVIKKMEFSQVFMQIYKTPKPNHYIT